MSKRFTEIMKWQNPWFRKLSPKAKLLWLYIVDCCDNAGVWQIDMELASAYIGQDVDLDDIKSFNDHRKERVILFNQNSSLFVKDYVEFQIVDINSIDCDSKLTNLQKNCLLLVLKYIDRNDLTEEDFGIITGKLPVLYSIVTGIGKGKGKDKGKDNSDNNDATPEDNGEAKKAYGEFKNVLLTDTERKKLEDMHGLDMLRKGVEILGDYIKANGRRYKDHYAVLKKNSWVWTKLPKKGPESYI